MIIKETKDYVVNNGLGKIVFSKGLLASIINKVIVDYPEFKYQDHKIENLVEGYLEVSLFIKSMGKFEAKPLERFQKDLLLIMKKSLQLNCILAINMTYGK